MKYGRKFRIVAGLGLLLALIGFSSSATAALATPSVSSPDVLAVDTTEVQFSVVANAQSLTPVLSIQLATDYSFATLAVDQKVNWGQTLDNQDHEFNVTISNLSQDTLYFVRAVLATNLGTTYSELAAFRTLAPIGIVIQDGQTFTKSADVTIMANPPVEAVAVELSNSNDFAAAVSQDLGEPIAWVLPISQSGQEVSVYARYELANQTYSAVFTDSIGFDNTAPQLGDLLVERIGSTIVVTMTGSDAHSGLARVEFRYGGPSVFRPFANSIDVAGSLLPNFAASKPTEKLPVRVWDRAGNSSEWYLVAPRLYPRPSLDNSSFTSKVHTLTIGDWGPEASFAFQWLKNGKELVGATNATYTHSNADLGAKLSARIDVSKRGVLIKSVTTGTELVLQAPSITKGGTVSGKAKVGQTLAIAKPTTVAYPVAKVSYRWWRCAKPTSLSPSLNLKSFGCSVIAGATKSTYKLSSADASKYVVGNTVATGTAPHVARVYAKSTAKVVR